MPLSLEQVKEISEQIGERTAEEIIRAANTALRHSGTTHRVEDRGTADELLRGLAQAFLDEDNYLFAGTLILPVRMFNPDIKYTRDILDAYGPSTQLLLQGANGVSKCLGPDVPVMMFDGSIKKACEVAVGDVLMGDDMLPRAVFETSRGTDTMYEIIPLDGGMRWQCNSAHIITLARLEHGSIVLSDVGLQDYLRLPADHDFHMIRRVGKLSQLFGFRVKEIGHGEYFGFGVDGNRRFLLGDFTVTHNTWGMCVAAYLDWWRDPKHTMIKFAAVNEDHLRGTLMANVKRMNLDANLPIATEKETDMRMAAIGSHADMGISGVLFPQGADPKARLKGYRPKPIRKEPHPKWGSMSRTRFFGDEAQSYADGVFKDFGSLQSAMTGPDRVKIVLSYNPDDVGRSVVKLAMPHQGWKIEDVETLYRWKSRAGWDVLRLDGARSENVVARKIIFEGIQTFEGYMTFVRGSGGDSSAEYFEKARGWPPVKGAVNVVISPELVGRCRGNLNFVGNVLTLAHVDCAYQGEDSPIMTISRYGMANYVITESGEKKVFVDYTNPGTKKPRRCFQIDQQFKLPNTTPTELAEEVVRICRELKIPPENVVVDGSGNGFGTYSHLAKYWGNVLYIQWGRKATDLKVLHEDQEPASAVYDNIIAEMWFTTRRWLESGCFWIGTTINASPLTEQLTTRRYVRVRGSLLRVESKVEYKARGNTSPDEADSLIQGPQLIRERFYHLLPGMQVDALYNEEKKDKWSERPKKDEPHYSQDYIEENAAEASAHIDP